ncbi:glycoside hydrolase family 88 protein [Algoriphagus sp.]|uniref:glycoside hydrolase family 88 protein n=1 Tax=Algoriphagus sp. TaxID=1872435 RepID=UPI00391DDFBB
MNRRKFLVNGAIVGAVSIAFIKDGFALILKDSNSNDFRQLSTDSQFPVKTVDPAKRIPLGWEAFPILTKDENSPTVISFSKSRKKTKTDSIFLRLSSALDLREHVKIKAFLPKSKIELGIFDIRYSHPFQPFELEISASYYRQILKEGIGLELIQGSKEAWFYGLDAQRQDNSGLQPHLFLPEKTNKEDAFFKNLYSMNSFSPFGWLGGCVQDGLFELHKQGKSPATATLKTQLNSYLDPEKGIIFESPHTIPMDGKFNSLEDFLPFAAIANLYPDHISILRALEYIQKLKNPSERDFTGDVTTEGCYTLAYPLSVIACQRKNRKLAELAVNHLLLRREYLSETSSIYQRSTSDSHKTFKNWGRGVAWYLLGIVKTLREFENSDFGKIDGLEEIRKDFVKQSGFVLGLQNPNGMYYSYIDLPETGVDTSATAGIAAAFAWGFRMGILGEEFNNAAKLAYQGVQEYVSEDGFLRSVSQINRGGEDLQKSGYRVITQFGMGLVAQLYAGLNEVK